MYPKTFIETSRKIRTKQFIMVMQLQFRVVKHRVTKKDCIKTIQSFNWCE